jgi:hypothetical protein
MKDIWINTTIDASPIAIMGARAIKSALVKVSLFLYPAVNASKWRSAGRAVSNIG